MNKQGWRLAHGGMGGVALLPEEFEGADEGARAQLPAVHVGPLVEQHGEVAVGLNPLRQHVVHHCLRRRPYHQRLLQILATPCPSPAC